MASQYPNRGAPDPWAQPDPFAPPGMGQQQPAQFTGQIPPGMGPETPPWAQTGPTPTPSPIVTPEWPQAPQVAPAQPPGPPSAKLAAPWEEKQPKRKAAAPAPAATPQREAPPWESQPDPTMMRGQLEAERAGMQAQANDANAERAGRYAMAAQERLDMARQRDSEQRQDMLAAQAKLDAAAVELGNMRVDPDRYMRNLSTERTVASYVGAVLAGILNPTGPNSMVELTERQIDRDLESQRQDMDQARAGYQAKVSALAALRDIYGDERAAESAYRAEKWGLAGEQIKAEAMASESPLIAKNGQIAYVAALEQSEKYKQQAQQIAIENEQKNRALATDEYQAQTGRKQVGLGYAQLRQQGEQDRLDREERAKVRAAEAAKTAGVDASLVIPIASAPGAATSTTIALEPVKTRDGQPLRDERGNQVFRGEDGAIVSAADNGVRRETVRNQDGTTREIYTTQVAGRESTPVIANSDKDAEVLKTLLPAAMAFDEAAGRVESYSKGRELIGDADTGAVRSDAQMMLFFAKDILGTGALDAGMIGIWEKAAGGDPTAIRQMNTDEGRAQVAQVRRNIRRKALLTVRARARQGNSITEESLYGTELGNVAPAREVKIEYAPPTPIARERGTR